MKEEFLNDDGENRVVVDYEQSPVYTCYTRGTRNSLYAGDDPEEARGALEMSAEEWEGLLASDGFSSDD